MSRYIDADNLKKKAKFNFHVGNFIELSALQNAPTADVQEVKHGKWEAHPSGDKEWQVCSNCGTGVKTGKFNFQYCPICGTKMDKE